MSNVVKLLGKESALLEATPSEHELMVDTLHYWRNLQIEKSLKNSTVEVNNNTYVKADELKDLMLRVPAAVCFTLSPTNNELDQFFMNLIDIPYSKHVMVHKLAQKYLGTVND